MYTPEKLEQLKIDYEEKRLRLFRERIDLLQRVDEEPELIPYIKAACKLDVKWFINMWVVTYNPRIKPHSLMPFILYPRQEEMVDFITKVYEEEKWATIAKCRYTGASYVTLAWMLHALMFRDNFTGTLASNKAESVDKTNVSKSLFYKIQDMYKRLPSWLQDFDMDAAKTRMLIYNKATNSAIAGESGKQIGRGGRSSFVMVDEAAFVEADTDMVGALSENADAILYISTPKGKANEFYRMHHTDREFLHFEYRWQSDPRRSYEWRKMQDFRLGKTIARQELDIDFDALTEARFIEPEWITAAINAHEKIEGMIDDNDIQAGLDVALGGVRGDKTILTFRRGSYIEPQKVIDMKDTTKIALHTHEVLMQRRPKPKCLCFDADGLGAGVTGTFKNMDVLPPYEIVEFHGAGKPSNHVWIDREQPSHEFLYNMRAEAWYMLRERLRRTYEHLEGISIQDPKDMISLPPDIELENDLLKPAFDYRGSKIILESKKDMKKKGLSSPDKGDSLAMACYYEEQSSYWSGLV